MEPKNLSAETFSPLFSKILLLWTWRRTDQFRKLSQNVIREACAYLDSVPQKLISIVSTQIKVCDPTSLNWTLLSSLLTKVVLSDGSASTYLESEKLFLCGGSKGRVFCIDYTDASAYIIQEDGIVQQLPNMSMGRDGPGVVYVPYCNAIYVFGGVSQRLGITANLKGCEKFGLESLQWGSIGEMWEARSDFNPCLHESVVYLCGGFSTRVETFSPNSDTFRLLPDFLLLQSTPCTAVIDAGHLVVISCNYISKWSFLEERTVLSRKHSGYSPWSRCSPVSHKGVVYIVNGQVCREIDLTTGEQVRQAEAVVSHR